MTTRNDKCTTCGGFGYTVDTEGTMTGCFECFVEAHEVDNAAKMLNEFEPGSAEYIHYESILEDNCPEDDRGHEYEFAAHRCSHCNHLHPAVREAA